MNGIDFEECLKDSPAYRNQLRQATNHIDMLEDRLEQMSKSCNTVINIGKNFVQEFQKFLKCIYDVRELFASDDVTYKSLGTFGRYLNEIQALFSTLFEQTNNSVLRALTRMLKEDIKKVKDQGKLFERLSTDYDMALQKNADASKTKPHICEDTSKILIATRSCFGHTSIDYTYQINVLFNQHKIELVELLLSYINIHKAFFHQGHELLSIDTERDFSPITSQLTKMRQENVQKQKNLEKIHDINQRKYLPPSMKTSATLPPPDKIKNSTLFSSYQSAIKGRFTLRRRNHPPTQCNLDDNKTLDLPTESPLSVPKENLPRNTSQHSLSNTSNTTPAGVETIKEGYLFKRSHNKFKTWSRRWFFIRNGQLLYMRRNNSNTINESSQSQLPQSIMVPDLRLCTIRSVNDIDRRFVFEILSPNSSHLLQADSQALCDQWISSLQLAIKNSFKAALQNNHQSPASSSPKLRDESSNILPAEKIEMKQRVIREKIEYVRSIPGNEKCCDCDAEGPEWASINLGILLCLNCGGAHRGLGVNLSKVRSLHMDTWDLETLLVMAELGNTVVNEIYEAQKPSEIQKPNAETDATTRRAFIEAKYVQKLFIRSLPTLQEISSLPRSTKRLTKKKSSLPNDNDENKSTLLNRPPSPKRTTSSSSDSEKATPDIIQPSTWDMNMYLYEGARYHNVMMMLHALALGADKNFIHESDHGRTPLIQTMLSRSVAAAEFLLINNAKVNLGDHDGKTPLHYATQLANRGRGPIILLLKRGADPLLKDKTGDDSCALAMAITDPDVITWFRLVALHEQMKEEDADAEKTYISILDDTVYMKEIARTPSFS